MISDKADKTELSVKTRNSWLSNRHDVVKAWLTTKTARERVNTGSAEYYFLRVAHDILMLEEVRGERLEEVSGERTDKDLTAIAEHLVRDDRCSKVKDMNGTVICQIEVPSPEE